MGMDKEKSGKERRTFPRLRAYHLAKYRVVAEGRAGKAITASIKDISGAGICLRTDETIPVLSIIHLFISFPHFPEPIPCLGKVCWVRQVGKSKQYDLGVRFVEIEEIALQTIIRRVEDVLKKVPKEEGE